jgi:TolB-like protein/tetratricopeptide (TPR) repeat protein
MSSSLEPIAASIVVAPFREGPEEPDARRLANGFLEDVIAELARFPEFEVLSARTSLALSPEELEPVRLSERFGVTHLLDSSISPSAETLRVRASLIDVPSGVQVWSQRYDVSLSEVFAVQEDVAAHVANQLKGHIHRSRLARARTRPLTTLAAYDCWLRGRACLERGSLEADAQARELFERALELDPTYARGYLGLSLSHFNEWSCQLWSAWETNERLAFEYARRAVELDESDHLSHSVLGRILVYRRDYAAARAHLERAITLCPNDADALAQMSFWYAYLGEADTAMRMIEKALRLNPLHDASYYVYGALPYFVARRPEQSLRLVERAPANLIVDQSAYMAACHAYLGDGASAERHVAQFLETFQEKITYGRAPEPDEPLAYLLHVNPFERREDAEYLVEGLRRAGLGATPRRGAYLPPNVAEPAALAFDRETAEWMLDFGQRSARVKDMKGLRDLALLLASPGERLHVMEIAGRTLEGDAGSVMDTRTRAECQRKLRDLEEDIAIAEQNQDLGAAESARAELERLKDALISALGLGGRSRKLGDPVEKARTAVTWRIRSAIKKIAGVHPDLARHLDVSVRTGTFCAYVPERAVSWRLTM